MSDELQAIVAKQKSFVRTYSGKSVYPFNPSKEQFCIEDIAQALSNQCRFNGHLTEFYSVAQHSVYVSRMLRGEHRLFGLLHDAAEAYISDIPTPVKRFLPAELHRVEDNIMTHIADQFGFELSKASCEAVKRADYYLLCAEARQLHPDFKNFFEAWDIGPDIMAMPPTPLNGIDPEFRPWMPKDAKRNFINEFGKIRGGK